jgi:hypothetical protein
MKLKSSCESVQRRKAENFSASDLAAQKRSVSLGVCLKLYLSETFMRQTIINIIENKNNERNYFYGSLAMRHRVEKGKKTQRKVGERGSET